MKRAVLCVSNPQDFIPKLNDYSLMIINPASSISRNQYLLEQSDYSLLITQDGEKTRNGKDYENERLLWYTSGTTGDSKFCSFTQEQLDLLAKKICKAYNLTADDRYVSVMSLWHAHGQGFYWATQLAGCKTDFLSISHIRSLPKYSPTFITAIPEVLKSLLNFDLKSLRFIRSASSPLPNLVYTDLKNKFNVPVIEAFGMTEALSHCFTNPLHGEQRIGTVGLPDGIEADIVDGHLYIKGPTLAYQGWYDTGDLAKQDEKGYYCILGRSRDQINIKGIKLNPASLENKIKTIPGLIDVVIFGSNNVKCLYVGNVDPVLIKNELLGLGKHCFPTLLKCVESIPISPSGKVSRSWLEKEFA